MINEIERVILSCIEPFGDRGASKVALDSVVLGGLGKRISPQADLERLNSVSDFLEGMKDDGLLDVSFDCGSWFITDLGVKELRQAEKEARVSAGLQAA